MLYLKLWLYGFDCSSVPQDVIVLPLSAFLIHTVGKYAKIPLPGVLRTWKHTQIII